ncbi:hypothetical protein ALC57_06878 [Trachymyrmex cornetzi]|uniref:Uncharacterized protein n=1 Tax=Trachymyrmex cornetzi TaxID=471704 RepID=A0A195E6Z7_9HYME|nr:hypothetical protein ALC57_06878 [Trachymyrmex cornetzi]
MWMRRKGTVETKKRVRRGNQEGGKRGVGGNANTSPKAHVCREMEGLIGG